MKIGIFTETYRPTVNGVVVSVDTFKSELEKKGHTVFIFAPFNHKAQQDPGYVYRFPSLHLPNDPVYPLAIPLPFQWAKEYFPLELIAELDIIHIQHYSYMGQYGLRLAKMYDIPTVYTYHTMAELYTANVPIVGALFRPAIRALTRYTARQATQIITPTSSVRHYLKSLGITQPIAVASTGIYTERYKHTSQDYLKTKYHIPTDQNILLYVGRLSIEKNIQFLMDAFVKVLKSCPHTHLVLIGSGPDKDRYAQWIMKNKLHKHITITGFLPREETIKLFGAGDLFVFPSTTDTQGIVILEAMASGVPPVAINVLGPHDLIKNNITGKLTRLNLEQFSDTITDLLTNPVKRKTLSTNAQKDVKRYDAKATAEILEAVYQKLIEK